MWRGRKVFEIETTAKLEELKKRVRKLTSQAGIAKMELHELTVDLPRGWSEITSVAEKVARAFAALQAAKKELAAMENANWEARSRNMANFLVDRGEDNDISDRGSL
jgi:hypothetical protein